MSYEGKAVLLSIRPEWADKILTGEKTMEVRRTRPRLETPFKCYIYATKCRDKIGWLRIRPGHGWQRIDGMVIAKFTCDEIERVHIPCPEYQDRLDAQFIRESCMSYYALHNYCPEGDAYFWHISDLKVYDEPVPLEKLSPACLFKNAPDLCRIYGKGRCEYQSPICDSTGKPNAAHCKKRVENAPMSWIYVEDELKDAEESDR